MATPELRGLTVAILATTGFEQVEFTEPRKALDDAGATTRFVAPTAERVRAWDRTDWGARSRRTLRSTPPTPPGSTRSSSPAAS